MAEKTVGERLKEELFLKKENGLKNISDEKWEKISAFAEIFLYFKLVGDFKHFFLVKLDYLAVVG